MDGLCLHFGNSEVEGGCIFSLFSHQSLLLYLLHRFFSKDGNCRPFPPKYILMWPATQLGTRI